MAQRGLLFLCVSLGVPSFTHLREAILRVHDLKGVKNDVCATYTKVKLNFQSCERQRFFGGRGQTALTSAFHRTGNFNASLRIGIWREFQK
jgi:hypothetical protein